jgi:LmbE family N-acetylglucosaminyl deacetylase
MTEPRPYTLMTVHAHPDDETIGTGGLMAKSVVAGHRVVLVTCTRGEQGDIVVPDLDTPENHRRLGEIRAGELEAAMGELGVTEWENLGYRDSDMMGRVGNKDPRTFWQADIDEAARRLVWLVRRHRPHVMTTYNDFGGYGHPDHIRTHDVSVRAYDRAGDTAWYPEQLAPEHGGMGPSVDEGGLAPWSPLKLYEQAIPASVRNAMRDRMEALGEESFWSEPKDATARGLPGPDGEDAGARCVHHHLDRHLGRAGPEVGGDLAPRHPDEPGQPIPALRQGRLA